MESRIIEQLVYQWWMTTAGGYKVQQQVPAMAGKPHTATIRPVPFDCAQGKRDDSVKSKAASSSGYAGVRDATDPPGSTSRRPGRPPLRTPNGQRPWAKLRVARFLGVSHTWVNKLVRKFEADPERVRRKMAAFAPASIEKLERAREETRWEREHGRLRETIRRRRVKVTIQGKKQTVVAVTRVERQRRQEQVEGERARLRGEKNQQQIPAMADKPHTAAFGHVPLARQAGRPVPFDCAQGKRNDNIPLPYREVPEWAKGLLLSEDPGTLRSGPFVPQGKRTPRPVPFAFRRRR